MTSADELMLRAHVEVELLAAGIPYSALDAPEEQVTAWYGAILARRPQDG